jgi:ABC-type antimicrobial peptide transport system ATPase subunit
VRLAETTLQSMLAQLISAQRSKIADSPTGSAQPLTKVQLKKALLTLLQRDDGLITTLHDRYLAVFSEVK